MTTQSNPQGYLLARRVLAEIAERWGFKPEDVCGKKRSRVHVQCRVEIARALRHKLNLSLQDVAHVMNKDHTSVMHMLSKPCGSESEGGC